MASPPRRPTSAGSMGQRTGPRHRPMSGRSEPSFKTSNCGVPVLQTDPDRDALLIKQYEVGISKKMCKRAEAYKRYLPNLTKKEKKLLGISEIPKLKKIINLSYNDFSEVAERENMDVLQRHSDRESQVDKNLYDMSEATAELNQKLKAVKKQCQKKTKQNIRERRKEDQKREEDRQAREQNRLEQDEKLRQMTYDYYTTRREIESRRDQEFQEKLDAIRQQIEVSKSSAEDREATRKQAARDWNKEMKLRYKEMRARTVDGSDEINYLRDWEEERRQFIAEAEYKRQNVREMTLKGLRDREAQLRERHREAKEKAAQELEDKKAQWQEAAHRRIRERRDREKLQKQKESEWADRQRRDRANQEERVRVRREKYLADMGLNADGSPSKSRPTTSRKTFTTQEYDSDA